MAMQTRKRSNSSSSSLNSQAPSEQRPKLNAIHELQDVKPAPKIVTHEEWLKQRKELLQKEKQLTRHVDEVIKARRELGWEKVFDYTFDGAFS
jgi:hypothetical protein